MEEYNKNQQALLDFARSIDAQEFLSDVEQPFRDAVSGFMKLLITYDRIGKLDVLGGMMIGIIERTRDIIGIFYDGENHEEF